MTGSNIVFNHPREGGVDFDSMYNHQKAMMDQDPNQQPPRTLRNYLPKEEPMAFKTLNKETLVSKGWIYQEQAGINHVFHTGFDGHSWWTLTLCPENGVIAIKRHLKFGAMEAIKFEGSCPDWVTLHRLMELIGIPNGSPRTS